MNLDSIVQVQIDRITKFPTQAGFGTPAVLDINVIQATDVLVVSEIDEMIDAGFATSDQAYKAVAALLSQNPRPPEVKVLKRAANVAQVNTVTVGGAADGTYSITINGVLFSFVAVGNTATQIRDGLVTAINAGAEPVTAAPVAADMLTLTADVAGVGFSTVLASTGSPLTQVFTTANVGADTELARLREIDDDFYFLLTTDRTVVFLKQLSAAVELLIKLFAFETDDADSKNLAVMTDTTSLFAVLVAANRDRTFYVWTKTANLPTYPAAAWVGKLAPKAPGSATWKFKSVSGPAADALTSTELANIQGKNGNVYVVRGGISMFEEGVLASGEYIDIIHGTDLIQARIQEAVFGLFVTEDKVPMDNGGIEAVALQVEEVLVNVGVGNNILRGGDDAPVVTVPDISDVPAPDRAARFLDGVEFEGFYSGAIHKTKIQGRLSV